VGLTPDPLDDLDRLVSELDEVRGALPAIDAGLVDWLRLVASREATDLLLVAGEPPTLRVDGRLERTAGPVLDGQEIEDLVFPTLATHAQRDYRDRGIADASLRLAGVGRFRINLHHERGRAAAAIRRLPARVPSFESLGLPPGAQRLSELPRGLVLIAGATGSGKTTTMAAVVDAINHRDAKHIVTIEDPIEYEHVNASSVVQQVEIGIDAPDFPTALRSALRQQPDVIVVGEMRDPETMRLALAAGETGHLVLSTIHATDVESALARMADSFPADRQPTVRQEIAAALAAVYVQTLLPRLDGHLVPAAEMLVVGYGARQHIRRSAFHHLHQEITITRRAGSFSLEEGLARLVGQGTVDRAEAQRRANHPDDFEQALGTLS